MKKLKLGDTMRVKPAMCPNCGHVLDGTFGVSDDDGDDDPIVPQAGCPTVCAICASLLEFTAELTLIPLQPATRAELEQEAPDIWVLLKKMRDYAVLNPGKHDDRSGRA